MSNDTQALEVTKRQSDLKSLLVKALPSIQSVAAKRLDPERLVRIALVAASRRPDLLNCSAQSILSALVQAAEVGLEPETPLQHAYLVPFRNSKNGKMEATFMPSFRGLAAIAMRTGILQNIWARTVHENDVFDREEGLEPRLVHKPLLDEEARGKLVAVYAVAVLKDGVRHFEVMSAKEIEKIRTSSKAGNHGPWVEWPEMMARKTVAKRLLRQLPIDSEDLAAVVEADNVAEGFQERRAGGGGVAADNVVPLMGDMDDASARATSRGDKLAAEMAAKKKSAKAETPAEMSDDEKRDAERAEREPGDEG